MHAVGASDFSINDIQHPTFKRVKIHLSALINFCKFWAEQHANWTVRPKKPAAAPVGKPHPCAGSGGFGIQELQAESDSLTAEKEAMQDENNGMADRILAIRCGWGRCARES
jgi:hypothetical protein